MTAHAHSPWADRMERLSLIGLLALLASRLVPHMASKPAMFLYLASETLVVALITFRRSAHEISHRPADWVIAFTATFLPLLVVRSDGDGVAFGSLLLIVGFGISVGAQLSLLRSFGVVAANRGVRTGGLYGIVRHPMYLGYFLTHVGFLLSNPVPWNAGVYALCAVCQLYRMRAEERVLSADTAYMAFAATVRYRLVPFVY